MKNFAKRISALVLAVVLSAAVLCPAAFAAQLPSLPKDQCVVDGAGVLSSSTVQPGYQGGQSSGGSTLTDILTLVVSVVLLIVIIRSMAYVFASPCGWLWCFGGPRPPRGRRRGPHNPPPPPGGFYGGFGGMGGGSFGGGAGRGSFGGGFGGMGGGSSHGGGGGRGR